VETNSAGLLFKNSSTSIFDLFASLYTLKIKHKLSDLAINDLLKITKLILPDGNACPKNIKQVQKMFFQQHASLYYTICSKCENLSLGIPWKTSITSKTGYCQINSVGILPPQKCGNELIPFITFDVEAQIKSILDDNKIKMIKRIIQCGLY
jgi:hypothetical protein